VTIERRKKTKLASIFFFIILNTCSNASEINGAQWSGQSNFMHVTKEKMDMIYSVDITGQKVFLGGYYEIIKKNTDQVVFRLNVEELEFNSRVDGKEYCRIWGRVDNSDIQSYLYADDCLPIKKS
tara:strand:- start:6276 stop:6650 length:375 start_codon:yes stop_codon:yes gene_type:complete